MPDQYDTRLSQADESAFQKWKAINAPRDSGEDYDLRGAFKGGANPAANGHFPDTWKKPNHPTFSNESKFATPDAPHWEGNRLIGKGGNVVADETPKTTVKSYKVGDTTYQFPDDFDDAKVQGILTQQGIIQAPKSGHKDSLKGGPSDAAPVDERGFWEHFKDSAMAMPRMLKGLVSGEIKLRDVPKGMLEGMGNTLISLGQGQYGEAAGDVAGSVVAGKAMGLAADAVPPVARAAGRVVGKAANAVADLAKSPGAAEFIEGVPEVAAGAGMLAHGNLIHGIPVTGRGVGQIIKGFGKRSAAQASKEMYEQKPGQPTPEMLRQAAVPLTAEEEALAQHVMQGTEPQVVPAAQPVASAPESTGRPGNPALDAALPVDSPVAVPSTGAGAVSREMPPNQPITVADHQGPPVSMAEDIAIQKLQRDRGLTYNQAAGIVRASETQPGQVDYSNGNPPPIEVNPPEVRAKPQSTNLQKPPTPKAQAKALSDKLVEWGFSPDEAEGMGKAGWQKLADEVGVELPKAPIQGETLFNLTRALQGKNRTAQQLFEDFKKGGKDKPAPRAADDMEAILKQSIDEARGKPSSQNGGTDTMRRTPNTQIAYRSTTGDPLAPNKEGVLYTTPDVEYAKNWGDPHKLEISPVKTLDLTKFAHDASVEANQMRQSLVENGVKITDELQSALERVEENGGEPLQYFGQIGKQLVDALKKAGFDSAKINEYTEGGGKSTSTLLFDAKRARMAGQSPPANVRRTKGTK